MKIRTEHWPFFHILPCHRSPDQCSAHCGEKRRGGGEVKTISDWQEGAQLFDKYLEGGISFKRDPLAKVGKTIKTLECKQYNYAKQ